MYDLQCVDNIHKIFYSDKQFVIGKMIQIRIDRYNIKKIKNLLLELNNVICKIEKDIEQENYDDIIFNIYFDSIENCIYFKNKIKENNNYNKIITINDQLYYTCGSWRTKPNLKEIDEKIQNMIQFSCCINLNL